MTDDNPIRLLRGLKGAPLSILCAMSLAGKAVSQSWLERVTGYTDKPVSQALAYLKEIGLVDGTNRDGWRLSQGTQQLRLTEAVFPETSRNNSDSPPSSPELDLKESINLEVEEVEGENESEKIRLRGVSPKNPAESAIWEELALASITHNPRTEALVRLPHVNPEYVRAHRLGMERAGKGGAVWAGLLITILERGDPSPPLNASGHLLSCDCADCLGSSYISGEFAEFIEH